MPDNIQVLDPLAASERRTQLHSPLHDPDGEVWIYPGVPISLLIATAEYGPSAGRPCHHVARLAIAVVGPRDIHHLTGLVAHHNDLAASRNDLLVLHAAELRRHETSAVDDEVDLLRRVDARPRRLRDVTKVGALKDNAIL